MALTRSWWRTGKGPQGDREAVLTLGQQSMDASDPQLLDKSLRTRLSRTANLWRARSDKSVERLVFLYGARSFDDRFGVHTIAQAGESSNPAQSPAPLTVTPSVFHRMIADTGVDPASCAFVDLCCGGGRVLLLAAADHWKAVLGLASSQESCQLARHNVAAVRKKYPRAQEIEVRLGDIRSLALPMVPTVLLLDAPAAADELRSLLSTIEQTMADYPRELYLLCPRGGDWTTLDAAPGLRLWVSRTAYRIYMVRTTARSASTQGQPGAHRSAFQWEVLRNAGDIEGIAAEWDALARGNPASLMSDAAWTRCMFDAFEACGRERAIHVLRRWGKLEAVVPLQLKSTLPRVWYSVDNEHSVYGAFTANEDAPEVIREVLRRFVEDGDAVLFRRVIRTSPLFDRLLDAAGELHLPTVLEPTSLDTYFKLFAPWPEFERTLPRSQVRDAEKKRALLRKRGDLRFEVVVGGDGLAASLYESFGLEASGWKGQHGSPIMGSADTVRFYTDLAVRTSAAGRFALYLLRLDGRIIAFGYGLRGESRVDLLKIGYDQGLSEASPGRLLQLSAMQHEVERGLTTTFHLGRMSAWKQRWSPRLVPICRVWVMSDSLRARALLGTKPYLRSLLHSHRGVVEAVQWARRARQPSDAAQGGHG